MAIDKSKENTRIADILAIDSDKVKNMIAIGIDNPSIYKQFIAEEDVKWEYAVAAGLLTEEDVQWIKEHANEEDSEETPTKPADNPEQE